MKILITQIARQQGDTFDTILVTGETKNGDIVGTFQISQKVHTGAPLPDNLQETIDGRAQGLLTE
ncbi:hypothetical protein KO516_23120 [Citreicella sp. C3M06]|uniref:hypothetical protein n=1 Tax=Citreicella sp. C3M06 TaxID=2841564 RepID=UPI001C08B145|nr:hypothetical protein [Citreicella sp. C3M06]MBU2963666.1 hypothetical protein [Citreicella sp. C3M06]